ncbi:MAG: class I SAM-dependent methyltransferase [Anaerolineales bacterium]|nr:class I SAM-dependent methyltransferase [Anaerolineales bacterium]
MKSDIARRLVALNREFYQTLAAPFSATRGKVQPGAQRLLGRIPPDASVADLGCGNGNAAKYLADRGFHGRYAGFDLSTGLLEIARSEVYPFPTTFQAADFLEAGWEQSISQESMNYVFAFAVLHHIPGADGRRAFLAACRRMLVPDGILFLSGWQFQRSERLRKRVVAWSEIGVNESDLEEGDYLLDWRHESRGLRYVHVIRAQERLTLAEQTGFSENETFESDGKEGNLADYAVWTPSLPSPVKKTA